MLASSAGAGELSVSEEKKRKKNFTFHHVPMSRGFHRAPFDPGTLMYSSLPIVDRLFEAGVSFMYSRALRVSRCPLANGRVRCFDRAASAGGGPGGAESAVCVKENSHDCREINFMWGMSVISNVWATF